MSRRPSRSSPRRAGRPRLAASKRRTIPPTSPASVRRFEAEVVPGLAGIAAAELAAFPHLSLEPLAGEVDRLDAVRFSLAPGAAVPHGARTVTALQRLLTFDVPRPKALLGDAVLRTLLTELRATVDQAAARGEAFHALRLEAAGRDSAVLQRLAAALAVAAGVPEGADGDLKVRVRPSALDQGWDVLIRTTSRPLSARAWRVANLPGGLNACVAATIWREAGVEPHQRVLNLMCGSGTLLIERALLGPAARLVGVDCDPAALAATRANAEAASARIDVIEADATATPFAPEAFDVIVTDPPWGDVHGEARDLGPLYTALLAEAARTLVPGGRCVVVSHALRAFETALASSASTWSLTSSLRVFHGGHRPAIYALRRR